MTEVFSLSGSSLRFFASAVQSSKQVTERRFRRHIFMFCLTGQHPLRTVPDMLFPTLADEVLQHGQGIHTAGRGFRACHALRMPLDSPDRERFVLNAFDDRMAVCIRPGSSKKAFSKSVQSLVVIAVDIHMLTK